MGIFHVLCKTILYWAFFWTKSTPALNSIVRNFLKHLVCPCIFSLCSVTLTVQGPGGFPELSVTAEEPGGLSHQVTVTLSRCVLEPAADSVCPASPLYQVVHPKSLCASPQWEQYSWLSNRLAPSHRWLQRDERVHSNSFKFQCEILMWLVVSALRHRILRLKNKTRCWWGVNSGHEKATEGPTGNEKQPLALHSNVLNVYRLMPSWGTSMTKKSSPSCGPRQRSLFT